MENAAGFFSEIKKLKIFFAVDFYKNNTHFLFSHPVRNLVTRFCMGKIFHKFNQFFQIVVNFQHEPSFMPEIETIRTVIR